MWSEQFSTEGEHLPLTSLKQELSLSNPRYIGKEDIPPYPRPELHVSHLSHSTHLMALRGIKAKGGFKNPQELVWFSLTVSPEELREAASREMSVVCPEGHEERMEFGLDRPEILQEFASSSAFRSSSRYGSFRFTFSLAEVLDKYSQQFCGGKPPVLRVLRTVLYKQEVMYAVLVHSPDSQEMFSEYPLSEYPRLEDTPGYICAFRAEPEPHFIWRPQAMSGTHRFGLVEEDNWRSSEEFHPYARKFYVWDHVSLALHVGHEVLEFEDQVLGQKLWFCKRQRPAVRRGIWFQTVRKAAGIVMELWGLPLKDSRQSPFHICK